MCLFRFRVIFLREEVSGLLSLLNQVLLTRKWNNGKIKVVLSFLTLLA